MSRNFGADKSCHRRAWWRQLSAASVRVRITFSDYVCYARQQALSLAHRAARILARFVASKARIYQSAPKRQRYQPKVTKTLSVESFTGLVSGLRFCDSQSGVRIQDSEFVGTKSGSGLRFCDSLCLRMERNRGQACDSAILNQSRNSGLRTQKPMSAT